MDTTRDISKPNQFSEIIRYVEIINDEKRIEIKICESFMYFTKFTNQTASGLKGKKSPNL